MHDQLFVYGSLMGDIHSNIARFLQRNSRFLGLYQIRGRLYDLGCFPGLILTPEEDHWVTGHLFQLRDPASVLFTLDDYEGIVPGAEATSPYRRVLAEVLRETESREAWVYEYNEPVDDHPLIPFTNYLDYLKINETHQRFIQSV